MRDDRGSITYWVLGLTFMLLAFGGIALDFWRALAVQREIAAVADAASIAAASGIDEEHYRVTGEVRLDPQRAVALGLQSVAAQSADLVSATFDVAPDGSSVAVEIVDEVPLGLLLLLVGDDESLTVRGVATAAPTLIP